MTNRSMFEISQDLINLFSEIENQEGECTEEQNKALEIKTSEMEQKLDQYKAAINQWQSDINACKEEEKRLKERRGVYGNRIEKLKSAILSCVEAFGKEGKTNRYIETTTARFFTKSSLSVERDETRIGIFMDAFEDTLRKIYDNLDGNLTGFDKKAFLRSLNSYIYEWYQNSVEPFTLYDLDCYMVDITAHANISYFLQNPYLLEKVFHSTIAEAEIYNISENTAKTELSKSLNATENLENGNCTFAKMKKSNSIMIK